MARPLGGVNRRVKDVPSGRGINKEYPQHLKIARGEARESKGRYQRRRHLLPAELITQRTATLDHIIGGLTNTINTIEHKGMTRGE